MAAARREEDIDRVLEESADRYGPAPDSLLNLADYGRIRVMADRLAVDTIDRDANSVVVKFRPQTKVDPMTLVAMVRQRPDLTLVPPGGLRIDLRSGGGGPPRAEARGPRASRDGSKAGSWWTARARAGEVTPGFTKEDMLRPAKEDPRAAGGVFDRVGGVLRELADRR